MEKKTVGSFIAVLRKSQGMTQRELAERLCVSDKAVSRWERDETAPDLTLIPVIADIFGVTCDEILRGEKLQNITAISDSKPVQRKSSEIQLKHLINMNLTKFKKQMWVVLGLTAAGAVLCLTLCLAGREVFGFGAGIVFAIAAAVCLGVFSSGAASFTDTAQLSEESVLFYKRSVYTKTFREALIIAAGVCFDVGVFFVGYLGEWIMLPIFAGVYIIIHFVSTAIFNKKYFEELKFPQAQRYNSSLKLKTLVAVLLVAAVLTGGIVTAYNLPLKCFSKGARFETAEEFKTYMRNHGYEDILWISEDGEDRNVPEGYSKRFLLTDDPDEFDLVRYKEYENSDDDGETFDENGFWYYENDYVTEIIGSSRNLPITCYTNEDTQKRGAVLTVLNSLMIAFCSLDIVFGFVVYFKKRKK